MPYPTPSNLVRISNSEAPDDFNMSPALRTTPLNSCPSTFARVLKLPVLNMIFDLHTELKEVNKWVFQVKCHTYWSCKSHKIVLSYFSYIIPLRAYTTFFIHSSVNRRVFSMPTVLAITAMNLFIVYSWYSCQKSVDYLCMGLLPSSLFSFIALYICFYANIVLFWLLNLCNIFGSQKLDASSFVFVQYCFGC